MSDVERTENGFTIRGVLANVMAMAMDAAVTEAIAKCDAVHAEELRAYELTVSNLREQLARRDSERIAEQAQEIERLRAALRTIAELDPDKDSDEGYNEWVQADCFKKAQELANAAMK